MRGVIYCRVSSKEQVEGTSLESQQAACRDYAELKHIEVLRVFVEEGESAKFADRTRLLELIDFCCEQKGNIDILIVWKVDRFSRNVTDHFSIKATLAKLGVRIASVTEPIDANPEGKLMETILAGFAEFDNNLRALRTVQGMRRKIQEGIFPWKPPIGYKSAAGGHEKKTEPDLPHEPAWSLIKKAFLLFAKGGNTQAEMGRLMASWGLGAADGRSLAPQSLNKLFTNPFYAGILHDPWSGDDVIGKHVALVTPDVFAQVQRVMAIRNRSVAHVEYRDEFPLRGLIRCAHCHHRLTAAFSTGRNRRYGYYFCGNRECEDRRRSIPSEETDAEFLSFLDEIAPRTELVPKISEAIIGQAAHEEHEFVARRDHQRKRVAEVKAEIAELIRMRAQQLLTNDEFMEQKRRLDRQRAALESEGASKIDSRGVREDLEKILAPLVCLRETWVELKPAQRARFGRLILPGGFEKGVNRTADLGLLFRLFRAFSSRTSTEVALTCVRPNPIFSEIRAFIEVLGGAGKQVAPSERRLDYTEGSDLQVR